MNGWAPLQFGKLLVVVGLILAAIGLVFILSSRFSFFGLGRLPGDISYKSKNVQVYFPIMTSIVLSIVITLVLWLISFLRR